MIQTTTTQPTTPKPAAPQFIVNDFTVIIDSREQAPYTFTGFECDADRKHKPLVIPTAVAGLRTGDYSIEGLTDRVAVERKSLSDLYGTLGGGRERFEREFQRLNEMDCAALVIESSVEHAINNPPRDSKLKPKVIYRTWLSWSQKYPRVHWYWCGSRAFGERTTFRILEKAWELRAKQ